MRFISPVIFLALSLAVCASKAATSQLSGEDITLEDIAQAIDHLLENHSSSHATLPNTAMTSSAAITSMKVRAIRRHAPETAAHPITRHESVWPDAHDAWTEVPSLESYQAKHQATLRAQRRHQFVDVRIEVGSRARDPTSMAASVSSAPSESVATSTRALDSSSQGLACDGCAVTARSLQLQEKPAGQVTAAAPANWTKYIDIAVVQAVAYVLTEHGELQVMGQTSVVPLPERVPRNATWSSVVSCYEDSACGILANGSLYCWYVEDAAEVPGSPAEPGLRWVQVTGYSETFCGIFVNGSAFCWGAGVDGSTVLPTDIPPGVTWVSIGLGAKNGCGVLSNGDARCWGNIYTGMTNMPSISYPNVTWSSISVSLTSACGVLSDGRAVCWGSAYYGAHLIPATAASRTDWASIIAGAFASCGIFVNGSALCWGDARNELLALNSMQADGDSRWHRIDVSTAAACGILQDGRMRCWSTIAASSQLTPVWLPHSVTWIEPSVLQNNACGVLSDGSITCSSSANYVAFQVRPNLLHKSHWASVRVGQNFACALSCQHELHCWGTKSGGQAQAPAQLSPGGKWVSLSVGYLHACALQADGAATCWGVNGGYGATDLPDTPNNVIWTDVSAGWYHSCGVLSNGSALCWGQAGLGRTAVPDIAAGTAWRAIEAGEASSCGLLSNGSVKCWGGDSFPKLLLPPNPGPQHPFNELSLGAKDACAFSNDSTITCWGQTAGLESALVEAAAGLPWDALVLDQLRAVGVRADGTLQFASPTPSYPLPKMPPVVPVGLAWAKIATGLMHTCAVTRAGDASCWGSNLYGQTDVSARPNIHANWLDVSPGYYHSCGLLSDGTARCWGMDSYGQCKVPTDIAAGTRWTSVCAAERHSCGTLSDGSIRCWGSASGGRLQLPCADGLRWLHVSCAYQHSCGLLSNGAVLCWGDDVYGQTGVPALSPSNVTWTAVSVGRAHSCGLLSDGRAMCWGQSWCGQTAVPTIEPNMRWVNIVAMATASCGQLSDGSSRCWGQTSAAQVGALQPALALTARAGEWCMLSTHGSLFCANMPPAPLVAGGSPTARLMDTVGGQAVLLQPPHLHPVLPGMRIAALHRGDNHAQWPPALVNLSGNALRAVPADLSSWTGWLAGAKFDLHGNPGADPASCGAAWQPVVPGSLTYFCVAKVGVVDAAWRADGSVAITMAELEPGSLADMAATGISDVVLDDVACAGPSWVGAGVPTGAAAVLVCSPPPAMASKWQNASAWTVVTVYSAAGLAHGAAVLAHARPGLLRVTQQPLPALAAAGELLHILGYGFSAAAHALHISVQDRHQQSVQICESLTVHADSLMTCVAPAMQGPTAKLQVQNGSTPIWTSHVVYSPGTIQQVLDEWGTSRQWSGQGGNWTRDALGTPGRVYAWGANFPVLTDATRGRQHAFVLPVTYSRGPDQAMERSVARACSDLVVHNASCFSCVWPPGSGEARLYLSTYSKLTLIGGALQYAPTQVLGLSLQATAPLNSTVHSPQAPPAGSRLYLHGVQLPPPQWYMVQVFVGSVPCPDVRQEASDSTLLSCALPPQAGRQEVSVGINDLTVINTTYHVLYSAPQLLWFRVQQLAQPVEGLAAPASQVQCIAIAAATTSGAGLTFITRTPHGGSVGVISITGIDLGVLPSHLLGIRVAGATCPCPMWVSSTEVRCYGLRGNLINASDPSLEVWIAGERASLEGIRVDESTARLYSWSLQRFALPHAGLASFGNTQQCDALPALATDGVVLTSIARTQHNQSVGAIFVAGQYLGVLPSHLQSIRVAGATCPCPMWVSSTEVRCYGLRGNLINASDPSLEVWIAGERARLLDIAVMGVPTATSVTPAAARFGETVTVQGHEFGRAANELKSVMVGSEPCLNRVGSQESGQWLSATTVLCTVPTGSGMQPVVVHTTSELEPQSTASLHLIVDGVAAPPTGAPQAILGYRTPGVNTAVHLSWTWPNSAIADVTASPLLGFVVQLAGSPDMQSAVTQRLVLGTSGSGGGAATGGGVQQVSQQDGRVQYSATVTGLANWPYWIQLAGYTSGGDGPLSNVSSAIYSACLPDEYLATHKHQLSEQVCLPCPAGAACNGLPAAAVLPRAGWYRMARPDGSVSISFAPCRTPSSCLGVQDGVLFNETQALLANSSGCAPGYTGRLCARCEPGWSLGTNNVCSECPSMGVSIVLFLLLACAAVAVLSYLVTSSMAVASQSSVKVPVVVAKLVLSHLQMVALMQGFAFRWPEAVEAVLRAFVTTSSVDESLFDFPCWTGSGQAGRRLSAFRTGVLIKLLMPLILALLAAMWWSLNYKLSLGSKLQASYRRGVVAAQRHAKKLQQSVASSASGEAADTARPAGPRSANSGPGSIDHGGDSVVRAAAGSGGASQVGWKQHNVGGFIVTLLVVAFLLHTSLTRTVMQLFTCVQLDDTGRQFLAADVEVLCDSAENRAWQIWLAVPALLLYVLGIPLGAGVWLWSERVHLATPRMRQRAGFLISGFRESAYFWESLVMLRKASLAVATVFVAAAGLILQVQCVLLIALGAYVLHMNKQPYKLPVLNQVEQASLAVVMCTMIAGLMLSTALLPYGVYQLLSVLVVAGNALLLIAAAALAYRAWRAEQKGGHSGLVGALTVQHYGGAQGRAARVAVRGSARLAPRDSSSSIEEGTLLQAANPLHSILTSQAQSDGGSSALAIMKATAKRRVYTAMHSARRASAVMKRSAVAGRQN